MAEALQGGDQFLDMDGLAVARGDAMVEQDSHQRKWTDIGEGAMGRLPPKNVAAARSVTGDLFYA
ncbi:MAG TPA: hypothetical protein VGH36_12060 [Acetobacteraceae bacterium]